MADRICRALDDAGISYFIDRQGIAGGMEFPEVLAQAIIDCKVFLLLGSANSYASKFTNSEIIFAFNKKERNHILPYLIDSAPVPLFLEFACAGINWRDIVNHPVETVLVNDILNILGREPAVLVEDAELSQATVKQESDEVSETEVMEVEVDEEEGDEEDEETVELQEVEIREVEIQEPQEPAVDLSPTKEQILKWKEKANRLRENDSTRQEAYKWFLKAAEAGDPYSMYVTGFHIYDRFNKVTWREAFVWLEKAAEKGEWNAMHILGTVFLASDPSNRAYFPLFKEPLLNKGFQYLLPDQERGFKYLQASAEQGHEQASGCMGVVYVKGVKSSDGAGWFMKPDHQQALKYLLPLADKDNIDALKYVGIIYMLGDGVRQDHAKAEKLFKKIVEKGYPFGNDHLVELYYRQKRYDKALNTFHWPCRNPETLIDMGLMYWLGNGTSPDANHARKMFEEAMKYSDSGDAEYYIGQMYEHGDIGGLFVNKKKKAAEWYSKAASLGCSEAVKALKKL